MHRPDGRHEREELLRSRRPGRWQRRDDRRGPRRGRDHAPDAAGVPRGARAPVRLLHARHDHGVSRPAEGERRPVRGGGPGGPGGQPVPVHGLPEHREARPGRRRPDERAGRPGGDAVTALEGDAVTTREIGSPRRRSEDARLITGKTRWTDNLAPTGTLHVAFLRSPHAHARITRVDTSQAKNRPGVVAVFSGQDLADEQGSLPCAWVVTEDMKHPEHPPMAVNEVRYVGEPVACVVARDRYAAVDALEEIDVDYEPLPAVVDMDAALEDGADLVHEDLGTNKSYTWVFENGDMDAAMRDAPVVIEREYIQQRLIPTAMEPRSVLCVPEGDEYTLYSATQIPHILRLMLATVTGIPEHRIRVVAPDVGGGFGSKLQVYGEEVIALLLARRLGRPVKWTESRSEGNMTVHHGRDQIQRLTLAADRDGRIRGLKVNLLADMGAYLMLVTPGIPLLGA